MNDTIESFVKLSASSVENGNRIAPLANLDDLTGTRARSEKLAALGLSGVQKHDVSDAALDHLRAIFPEFSSKELSLVDRRVSNKTTMPKFRGRVPGPVLETVYDAIYPDEPTTPQATEPQTRRGRRMRNQAVTQPLEVKAPIRRSTKQTSFLIPGEPTRSQYFDVEVWSTSGTRRDKLLGNLGTFIVGTYTDTEGTRHIFPIVRWGTGLLTLQSAKHRFQTYLWSKRFALLLLALFGAFVVIPFIMHLFGQYGGWIPFPKKPADPYGYDSDYEPLSFGEFLAGAGRFLQVVASIICCVLIGFILSEDFKSPWKKAGLVLAAGTFGIWLIVPTLLSFCY